MLWFILAGSLLVFGMIIHLAYQGYAVAAEDSKVVPYSDLPKNFPRSIESTTSDTGSNPPYTKVQTGPITLSIPSLGIENHIERTGLTVHGNMGAPKQFNDVTWYGGGPEPGQPGNAVIAGHFNNGFGKVGPFGNLDKIKNGDEIFVTNSKGQKIGFVVTEVTTFAMNASTEPIFEGGSKPRLVLITCEGVWQPNSMTYSNRLVVYAERAD